jgi:hypothetical protein
MSAHRVSTDGGFWYYASMIVALAMLFFSQDLVFAEASVATCLNTPTGSLVGLPPEITNWAKLECRQREQRIVAGDGWTWRHWPSLGPGSITSGSGARFVRVSYEVMSDEDKDRLINQFPNFAIPKKLKERQFFLLTAKTDLPSESRFMVFWPEPAVAQMYDLVKLPTEEAIMIANPVEVRKGIERVRRGEKY